MGELNDLINAGPRRCANCRRVVNVVYDHAARWAYCGECSYTIVPRDQELTHKDKRGLLRVGMKRLETDGYLPSAKREVGQ